MRCPDGSNLLLMGSVTSPNLGEKLKAFHPMGSHWDLGLLSGLREEENPLVGLEPPRDFPLFERLPLFPDEEPLKFDEGNLEFLVLTRLCC